MHPASSAVGSGSSSGHSPTLQLQQQQSASNHLNSLERDNAQLRQHSASLSRDNARLQSEMTDLRARLESTRSALRDSRDSLSKVQEALQPLMRNQQARDEQFTQLAHVNRMYVPVYVSVSVSASVRGGPRHITAQHIFLAFCPAKYALTS